MRYSVQVRDETNRVVYESGLLDVSNVGTNFDEAVEDEWLDGTDVERVLHYVAPEICPFDCSACRP